MVQKFRISLLSAAIVCFAAPAYPAVSHGISALSGGSPAKAAGQPASKLNGKPNGKPLAEVAYHDMRNALSVERDGDRWSFQRRELRIDRSLNCFLAGSGDLICFTASVDGRKSPARDITRGEELTPAGSR